MKKYIVILLLLSANLLIFPVKNYDDNIIISKISAALINAYKNYKDNTWIEKVILKLGKKTFIKSLDEWKENFDKMDSFEVKLHPILKRVAKIGDDNLPEARAAYFRSLLEELTLLGFKNLEIYHFAVKDEMIKNDLDYDDINIELIDESIAKPKYFDQKMNMYEKEFFIKSEIEKILKEKEVRFKIVFYAFAFKFFYKIRDRIIQKDIEKMKASL